MTSMPWLRLYCEFATDPVIQSLAFEDQRHYIILLCLKGSGVLDRNISPTNKDRIILRALGLDPVAGSEAKRRLMDVTLIDGNWQPLAWNKRQFVSDHSTERARKSRKTKKAGNGNATEGGRCCNGPDTDTDTDTENPSIARERFAEFWASYPRKVSKGAAEKWWTRHRPSDDLLASILAGLDRAKASRQWQEEGGKFVPHPATWLNAKGWEDEHEPSQPKEQLR